MLTFTIDTTAGNQTVAIPASWEQVTVERYAAMFGKTGLELLAAIAGLPLEVVQDLPEAYLESMFAGISFLDEPIPELLTDNIAAVKVGAKGVGQIEKAKEILTKFPTWEAAPYVVAIYATEPYKEAEAWALAEQYKQQPIGNIYATFIYLSNQITDFYEFYGPILKQEPDEDEIAAGVEVFAEYGFFSTVYSMCNGDLLKFEPMLKVPASDFYTALCFGMDKANYQKRLQEIKSITNQE